MKITITIDDEEVKRILSLLLPNTDNIKINTVETIQKDPIVEEKSIQDENHILKENPLPKTEFHYDDVKIDNETMILSFSTARNLAPTTTQLYRNHLREYSKFNKLSLNELLQEAIKEEIEGVREVNRKIKTRLINFYQYCLNEPRFSNSSSKKLQQMVKTWYRHEGVVIPYMPLVQIKKENVMTYDDILTKDEIKKGIDLAKTTLEKAIITFGASSGTARNEILHLTVDDFIKATKEYHSNEGSIEKILSKMEGRTDIVPLFTLERIKTNYIYNTCCSPEASYFIIKHLLNVPFKLKLDTTIFNLPKNNFNKFYQRINEEGGFGKHHKFGRFRSHMMRKFHATTIGDKQLVDALQGRTRDSITETYFKTNPKGIKEDYLKIMDKVMFDIDLGNDETPHSKRTEYKPQKLIKDWDMRYINFNNGRYYIMKQFEGKQQCFSTFGINELDSAKQERDLLEKYDWNYDEMIEAEASLLNDEEKESKLKFKGKSPYKSEVGSWR